jgi:Protein of unknown function (DUF992)
MRPIVMSRRLGIVAALALFLAGATHLSPADAAAPSGDLRCAVAGGASFILGSARALDCVYAPDSGGREHYRGRIEKFGLDIGYQRYGVIYWVVLSPALMSGPGALAGHYIGGSAEVAAGPGVSANALVGGNKIVLNPISVGGANGINVAATVTDLQLVYVGAHRGRRR